MKEDKKGAWLLSSESIPLSAGSPVAHIEQCLLQNQKRQRSGNSIFPAKCCNCEAPAVFSSGAHGAKPPMQLDLLPT